MGHHHMPRFQLQKRVGPVSWKVKRRFATKRILPRTFRLTRARNVLTYSRGFRLILLIVYTGINGGDSTDDRLKLLQSCPSLFSCPAPRRRQHTFTGKVDKAEDSQCPPVEINLSRQEANLRDFFSQDRFSRSSRFQRRCPFQLH